MSKAKRIIVIILMLVQSGCGVLFWKGGKGKQGILNWMPLALVGMKKEPNKFNVTGMVNEMREGSNYELTVTFEKPLISPVKISVSSSDPALLIDNMSNIVLNVDSSKSGFKVFISAPEDDNDQNENAFLKISSEGFEPVSFPIQVLDNDVQKIIAYDFPLSLDEGKSAYFKVRLNTKPQKNELVQIVSSHMASAAVEPSEIQFSPFNYSTPQLVKITALEDSNFTKESVIIEIKNERLSVASEVISIFDNDIFPVFLSPSVISINEGNSASVQIQLNSEPSASKRVYLVSSNPASVDISPSFIDFNSGNWNLPYTVTVQAKQDLNAENEMVPIVASGAGLGSSSVTVNAVDDEIQSLMVTGVPSSIKEGETKSISIRLAYPPSGTLGVDLNTSKSIISVVPSKVFFNASNYMNPQTVQIQAIPNDGDESSETVSLNFTAPAINSYNQNIFVLDKDTRIIASYFYSGSSPYDSVWEGQSQSFKVQLSGDPGIPQTISISSSLPSLATAASSITFDSSNWNIPQTVGISAPEDSDHNSDKPIVTLSNPGLQSDSKEFKIYDNDTVVVFSGSTALQEDKTGIINVKLSGTILDSVPVRLETSDSWKLRFPSSGMSLLDFMIDPANWNVNQSIQILSLKDIDSNDDTIRVSASSSWLLPSYTDIPVQDNQIIIDPTSQLSVNEDGTAVIRVKMRFPPSSPITVSVSSSNTMSASVNLGSLVFNSSDYNIYKSVTVQGISDTNNANESISIHFSSPVSSIDWNMTVYDKPPVISSFSPGDTSLGTVTISGFNFGANPSDNIVKFNGVAGNVISASATSLTVVPPASGTTGKISVFTSTGSAVSVSNFSYIGFTASSYSPSVSQNNVGFNSSIIVTFNSYLDQTSVSGNFKVNLSGNSSSICSSISFPAGNQIQCNYSGSLIPSSTYAVNIFSGIKNSIGVSLGSNISYTFSTAAPFNFVSSNPVSGSSGVSTNSNIVLVFNANVDSASVNGSNIQISPSLPGVSFSVSGTTVSVVHTGMSNGTNYTVNIQNIKNVYGISLQNSVNIVFTSQVFLGYRMFLTANSYTGNLGGEFGADLKCNSDSARPDANKTYKALIKRWRGLKPSSKYIRPDGTVIMNTDSSGNPPTDLTNTVTVSNSSFWFDVSGLEEPYSSYWYSYSDTNKTYCGNDCYYTCYSPDWGGSSSLSEWCFNHIPSSVTYNCSNWTNETVYDLGERPIFYNDVGGTGPMTYPKKIYYWGGLRDSMYPATDPGTFVVYRYTCDYSLSILCVEQ